MDLFDLVAKITLDSSEYDKGLKGAGEKASSFSKAGAAMWGVWSEVGRKAIGGVFSMLSSNVGGAVKRLDTLNNFPKVMQSLGFSAGDAEKGINALADGIAHLPTTLDAVASQAQQFVPMTGDIQKATDVTLALNNAMAAGGKDAESQTRAIEAWTKSMAKGKPEFEAWQSMVQTAPAQMDQLAKSMLGANANQNDLYEAMKDGSVSIDEVNDKMIELTNAQDGFDIAGVHYDNFAKQAENASAGIQMSITNMRASVQRNIANVIDAFNGATESVGGIGGMIQSVVPVFDSLGSSISDMLSGNVSFETGMLDLMNSFSAVAREAVSKGGELISSLISGMADAAPRLVEQAFLIMGNIRSSISRVLPDLLASGAELVGGIIEGMTTGIPYFVDGISSIFSSLTDMIDQNAESFISKGLDLVLGLSESLREGAGNLVDSGLEMIMSLAQGIADSLPALIEKVPLIVSNIANIINDNAPKLLSAGLNIIVTLGEGLIQAIPTLLANIPQIITAIWDVFTAVNWLSLGGTVVKAIGSGIKALGKSLPNTLKGLATKAMNAFKGVSWKNVGSTAVKLIASAIKGLASLPGRALKAVARAGMKAFTSISWGTVGKNVVQGIIRGVTAAASLLVNALKGLAKRALEGAKKALGISSPSKVFAKEVGRWIPIGLAKGITDNIRAVEDASQMMADATLVSSSDTFSDAMSGTIGQTVGDILQVQISGLASDISNGISDAMEGITVVLDRRTFGKMTRKAAGGVL